MDEKLLKRLFIVYFFIGIAAPVSYFIRILFARSLSIEEYGLFYAIIAFFGLIGIFNDLGMNPALVHYLPKFIKEKSFNKIKAAISIVFSVEVITSVLIAIFILSFKNILAEYFFKTNLALYILPLFAFYFIIKNIFELISNIFKGYRKEIFYSSINPIRLIIVLIFSFVAYLIFKTNLLFIFSLIWILSFLIGILLYSYPLHKILPKIPKKKLHYDKKISTLLLKYGFFVMLSSIAGVFLGRIDVIMLTYFKGVDAVAFYEIALPIASIILITINPLTTFLFPNVSHFYHSKKIYEIKSILRAIYNTGLFLFLPLGLIFFLFPQEIIIIMFGAKYIPAKIALQILSIGFIFQGFFGINFAIMDGTGQIKKKSFIIYLGAGLNIILNLLLIPPFGINGAALATTISTLIMFIFSIFHLEKQIKFGPYYKNWVKITINSLLFISIIYLLKTILNINPYLETAIVIIISGLIYLLIGFKWNILNYNNLKRIFIQTIKLR